MAIFGIGTETYLYINGLVVNDEIKISEHETLMPTQCKLPLDTVSQNIKSDTDFAITILCANTIASQLRITAETPKDLAVRAWNSQWDIILLSAILKCDAFCNLQCTHPLGMISESSVLEVTNYHMRGLIETPYLVTKDDADWIEHNFANAKSLLGNNPFSTAVHSMATYRWHSMPRIQLAILWTGIEALFDVSNELNFRISLHVSKFLANDNLDEMKKTFDDTKNLYKARSSAVHGSNIRGDSNSLVDKSASILNKLIKKCISINSLPNVNELIF